jgi:hypothetical protein
MKSLSDVGGTKVHSTSDIIGALLIGRVGAWSAKRGRFVGPEGPEFGNRNEERVRQK